MWLCWLLFLWKLLICNNAPLLNKSNTFFKNNWIKYCPKLLHCIVCHWRYHIAYILYIHKHSWRRRSMFVRYEDCWKDLLLRTIHESLTKHEEWRIRVWGCLSVYDRVTMRFACCAIWGGGGGYCQHEWCIWADYIAYDVIGGTGEDMKTERHLSVYARKASHVWGRMK